MKIKWPPPGSTEAKQEGCICPIKDNAYGKGILVGLSAHYLCNIDCPIHGSQVKEKLSARKTRANGWCKHDGSDTSPVPLTAMVQVETWTPMEVECLASEIHWEFVKFYRVTHTGDIKMEQSLFTLRTKARTYYPESKFMQVQWIRQTHDLLKSGKHILLTGSYKNGRG